MACPFLELVHTTYSALDPSTVSPLKCSQIPTAEAGLLLNMRKVGVYWIKIKSAEQLIIIVGLEIFHLLERNKILVFRGLLINQIYLLRNDKGKSLCATVTTPTSFNPWVRKKWERTLAWGSLDLVLKVWIHHSVAVKHLSEPQFSHL